MATTEPQPLRLADLLATLRRRRTVAGVAALLVGSLILFGPWLMQPPMHRAEASVTASRGLRPVEMEVRDPLTGLIPDQLINTLRELLSSREVLSDALRLGGLLEASAYQQAGDPIAVLAGRIRTSVAKNSWVITISLDDEDPVRAVRGLQAVLDAFISRHATSGRSQAEADLRFISVQLAESKAKLERCHVTEQRFRADNGIASTDPDKNHITARVQRLAELQANLDERTASSAAVLGQIQAANALPDARARHTAILRIDTISKFSVFGDLQGEIFRLEGEEAELSAKYLDKHPKLIELRSHLARKRSQMEDLITATLASFSASHQALLEQRLELQNTMRSLQDELNRYREKILQLQALMIDSQVQQKVHDELSARQAQIAALASYTDRRLIIESPPRAFAAPRLLSGPFLTLFAAIAAAAAAIAAALLADAFSGRLRSAQQAVDRTALSVLASIPRLPMLPHLMHSGPGEPAAYAESMRQLVAALSLRLGGQDPGRLILVASPSMGDGRTSLAVRLAAQLALAGLRTLVVDSDLRRPGMEAELGAQVRRGFFQALAGEPEVTTVVTSQANLDHLAAGDPLSNPGEILHSPCLAEWCGWARQHFDAVILDSPALSACSDALLLGHQADAIILLAQVGHTGDADLDAAWRHLQPVRQRCAGLVIVGD